MIRLEWLNRHDLSRLVTDAPYITARAESSLSDAISTVRLANPDMIFNEGDPKSILSGTEWQGSPIRVERNGETVLDGIVTDGVISRLDCTLEVQSHFSEALKAYCNSTIYNTDPATAILQLCKAAHIPIDSIDTGSFLPVSAELRNAGVFIDVIADKQYQTPLLDAINALLELGCMRAWLDTKLHVVMVPYKPQGDTTVLLKIRKQDILDDIQYGTTPRQAREYSLGYRGDSFGTYPAEGELGTEYGDEYFKKNGKLRPELNYAVETWTQSYNANSQWQLINKKAAHAIGQIKLAQDRRKRTASLTIRDNGSVPLVIGGVYDIKPWPGYGWLTGYEKNQGTIDLYFEEVLDHV
jgi:hypothetical protein